MNPEQKRQGDLLITRISSLPDDAKPIEGLTLAAGEATGHAHKLTAGRLYRTPLGELYFVAEGPAVLTHEEHRHLQFAPGVYHVRRQREYHPSMQREVAD